jgi:transcriptional regulator of NAD metabolism
MEQLMNGSQRRKKIVELLKKSQKPLSGAALGRETGVSRQVVVQDMALLRMEGYEITATARGYVLDEQKQNVRIFKTFHSSAQTEAEMNAIVDLGGAIIEVMVNHRVYGKVTAPLNIKTRRDVQLFMEQLRTGKSTPLLNITSGYHFHKVAAESEEILDEIEKELEEKGFLAQLLPYEQELADV